MDVLRKELTGIYAAQCLDDEALDSAVAARCREALLTCAGTDGDCRVLTDASADCVRSSGDASLILSV